MTITLNRPEVRNAFNDVLIRELSDAFIKASSDDSLRVIVIQGAGESFCAGADLTWMKSFMGASQEQNEEDANKLSLLLQSIDECSVPVVARVHGNAMGGGVGLLSVADIVIASEETGFALSEVKLGLIPAVISPYVLRKMTESSARRYFLTAEKFSAEEALRFGLVNQVVAKDKLDEAVTQVVRSLTSAGPVATREAKKLIRYVNEENKVAIREKTIQWIASLRTTAEAQEGMKAFLEKRKPSWL